MKRFNLFIFLALSVTMSSAFALDSMPLTPEAPFRMYSVADGLNQKSVLAVTQDQDGFLWIGTFGGVNRFDGRTFDSFTTRQGLRMNLIQALLVDSQNRVWAGDAAGGASLIENGRIVRVFEPIEESRGVARTIIEVGNTLYMGTQPGGLRALDLEDLEAGFTLIEGAPNEVIGLVALSEDEMLILSSEGLYRYQVGAAEPFTRVDGTVTALQADATGAIAVGTRAGQLGFYRDGAINWLDVRYEGAISSVLPIDGRIVWLSLEGRGIVEFDNPEANTVLPNGGTAPSFVDQEGVVWVPARGGLARYLGDRFTHYPITSEGPSPEVFSLAPGASGDFWFGTNRGLMHVSADGKVNNVSEQLGLEPREVRDLRLSPDGKRLWMAQVQAPTLEIDLQTPSVVTTLGDESTLNVSLERDAWNRIWTGSYLGQLTRYDPETKESRVWELGTGAAIYSMSITEEGYLYFSSNYRGVYRIDTRTLDAEPELLVDGEGLGEEFYTQVVATETPSGVAVWFSTVQGGVFRWTFEGTERVVPKALLEDYIIYSLQPLPDRTLVVATSRGVFRYAIDSGEFNHYTAFDGFLAIESKVHANYFDGDSTMLIGTTSGVTLMDTSIPMAGTPAPAPMITRRTIDDVVIEGDETPADAQVDSVLIEFTAVSTRSPFGIEYSYRLATDNQLWSAASQTPSIGFSNLSPGVHRFEVRARVPDGAWSEPAAWEFTVPTPFWRTSWFLAAVVLLGTALTWSIIQLRLRSVANANKRLRQEVAERTRSIEAGRRKLEVANQQLFSEIQERKKSDERRLEVEARFHQAYQNSPIGMALVDIDGLVYDANPRMKQLFWPESGANDKEPLIRIIASHDRDRFARFLDEYASKTAAYSSMEVECVAGNGDVRVIDFHPSAIRDRANTLKYIVLMAHDVTESRAMTDQLEYQAHFDELTGLLNRRAFAEKLEQASLMANHTQPSYLMFLDLDQFKVVNDTCGHAAGDELLRMVARLLKVCVRDEDTVARLGGDEFALILLGCEQSVALERAEDVRRRIQELEFLWHQEVFRIGVSIGVVPISETTRDLNELQQVADAACYAAKEAGRNRVHLVSGQSDAAHEHRGEMRWVQRLNSAIDNNNFVLFGQRIKPLSDSAEPHQRIEILLRMRDRNTNRLIPPGAFMPAAERYGLQGRMDQWVISNVIHLLGAQDPDQLEKLQIWVNLSGVSIGDINIARHIIRSVEEAQLPPGCLNFEITETAVIRKIEDAATLIESLQSMGCRFALDDFGSGLSSFGYLKRLNVDSIKIDGQFVRDIVTDPTDRIFVKSIIDIAHTLGMTVVSEFVEDNDILNLVAELGSDYAQGFGIHRPEPLESLVSVQRAARQVGESP